MQRAFYLTNRKLLCSRIVFRQSRFFHRAKILHNSDTLNVSEENQKKRAFLIWGSCDEGQLGMKHSHLVLSSPTRHQELENMNAFHVTVGLNHSIAFCEDGSICAWGRNQEGQLGVGDFVNRSVPTRMSLPLNDSNFYLQAICGPLVSYLLVIDEKDHRQTVWQWGLIHKSRGEEKDIVCNTPTRLQDFINNQTLSNSTKEMWSQFLERNYIRNIQTGDGFTLFLTRDAKLYALGDNEFGALGLGSQVKETQLPTNVSVGGARVCDISVDDNEVFSWGSNLHGQCGVGTKTNVFTPLRIRGLRNIIQVAAGQTHSMALDSQNNVWVWGSHRDGKLGIPNLKEDVLTPVCLNEMFPPLKKEPIAQIAAGSDHSCILTRSGKVYVWGFGQHGALGTGTLSDATTPQLLSLDLNRFGLQNFKIISVQCGMDITLLTLIEHC